MEFKVDTHGIREVLAELKKYEPETYKRIKKELETSGQPTAQAVGRAFPEMPLLNWHSSGGRLTSKSRLPAYSPAARGKVKLVATTKRPKGQATYGLIRLQQMNAGGQVYDSAGSVTAGGQGSMATAGAKFITNLDKHLRTKSHKGQYRSRVMFPFTKKYLPLIEIAVQESVTKINLEVSNRLNG